MARAVDQLQFKPVIEKVYAFTEAPGASDHVERGASEGYGLNSLKSNVARASCRFEV